MIPTENESFVYHRFQKKFESSNPKLCTFSLKLLSFNEILELILELNFRIKTTFEYRREEGTGGWEWP